MPGEIPVGFFTELENALLKSIWKHKRDQNNLQQPGERKKRKKTKLEAPRTKTRYRASITNTARH